MLNSPSKITANSALALEEDPELLLINQKIKIVADFQKISEEEARAQLLS